MNDLLLFLIFLLIIEIVNIIMYFILRFLMRRFFLFYDQILIILYQMLLNLIFLRSRNDIRYDRLLMAYSFLLSH
jgi:hypothetical protein